MQIVFISGWATGDDIWKNVHCPDLETKHISWDRIMGGEFELPDRCILTGWSLGGQIAMDLSRRAEVRGMVLVSSMTCIAASVNRPGIEPERCSMISRMLTRSRRGYLRSFFLECGAAETELPRLLEQSDEFSMEELISGLSVMFNHLAVPDPSVPVTVIHGTGDRIIPVEISRYLAEFVMPRCKTISIEGAGHLLPVSHGNTIGKAVVDLAGSLSD